MLLKETTLSFENMYYTKDEEEETLSLCDLPLYNDDQSDDWEQDLYFDSQGTSSISSSQNEYFEFITQEYVNPSTTNSAAGFQPENVIFCGKLIPYKYPSEKSSFESKKGTYTKKKSGNWGLFRWNFSSRKSSKRHIQSKNGEKGTSTTTTFVHKSSKKINQGKGYDFPVHKMSILTPSSSGKVRWYLFLFGISRFSNEVELRDIKSRQSRRQCPPPSPPPPPKGWGLIKALSCGGHHHANAMVAASIGRAPPPK